MGEKVIVSFILNGEETKAMVGPETTLLRFLRDEMGLTGTKEGCSTNHCGACMVLINGQSSKSCHFKMINMAGKSVETIEGLSKNRENYPIQAAFLAVGAVQCGFCTPGMIIATKALLNIHPDPSKDQILEGLKDNICRCTGYVKIIEAVQLASHWIKQPEDIKVGEMGFGHSVPDLEGEAKVKGSLSFIDDMCFAGMLYGKVLWSEHPHAEIISIDTEEASAVPGVAAVFTACDVPAHNGVGSIKPDRPVLCSDRVRYTGDAIVVVFAESTAAAERAVNKIKVSYRLLSGVFTPEEALLPESPKLYEKGNICSHLVHQEGDVAEAFRQSALVVEGHFETPSVEHGYLEPEASIGTVDDDGKITVYASTQSPFDIRKQLSAVLGLPEEKIRIITTPVGGAFGGKVDNTVEALVALGAYHLKRPVKIVLSRAESLKVSTKRHPFQIDYRMGFDSGGKITAVDAKLISDAGPYTALSPIVIDQASAFACGPYRILNFRVEGWAVYTNNANSSAFRGFGNNQPAVARECLLDEAARRLGLDPFEIRMINALQVGDRTVGGEILRASVAIRVTIGAARNALEKELATMKSEQGWRIGVGVASGYKNVGSGRQDNAGAIFSLQLGGRIQLRASAVDMGQGIRTALLQVASKALGIQENLFEVITGDTDLTIRHGPASAQRQVLVSGKAVKLAADEFKKLLIQEVAACLDLSTDGLVLTEGNIINATGRLVMTLEDLATRVTSAGKTVETSYYYTAPQSYADKNVDNTPGEYRRHPAYNYATQAVVVGVDETSGRVKVLKIIAVHDCGRVINPQKVEGQIEGGCLMGLGYALSESYVLEQGIPVTRTYGQLGIATIKETPEIKCILIEDADPTGPFGAKGIGELAVVPVTPALLNAIYDATGVRVQKLPLIPEMILRGMKR